jgi:hypothetical protein
MSFRKALERLGIRSNYTETYITGNLLKKQTAPVAMTTAAVITPAALLGGLITGDDTDGSTVAYTLPTGTEMEAVLSASIRGINLSFDFTIINLSDDEVADTLTLTAGDGFTIVGQVLIGSAHGDAEFPSSSTFRVRRTAANTYVAYKI